MVHQWGRNDVHRRPLPPARGEVARGRAGDMKKKTPDSRRLPLHREIAKRVVLSWQLYVLLLLPVAYLVIFCYVPMYGAQIAFKDFNIGKGITGSPWAGLKHFVFFIRSYMFPRLMLNTLAISLYSMAAGICIPVVFAMALNYLRSRFVRKTAQLITYAPYFLSTVVVAGMVIELLSPRTGLINKIIEAFGGTAVHFMTKPELFSTIFVWSDVWQTTGYSSIIYLAALVGIDPTLHEAAVVDGASRLQRIRFIDLPGIMPTIIIMVLLRIAYILNIGYEKILLLQNPFNLRASEVIDTYVYHIGIAGSSVGYSYASAIGLFKSLIGLALLVIANALTRRFARSSLW
jgi:putative aldouronate transport system permease protein